MKSEIVRVRLNEVEKKIFLEKASILNMTISDYIKYCCLINPPKGVLEIEADYK
ncbi:plasmid mobilization protein [Clostridium algidicarnis]|uniref:plasmid mobilization protein n=1 Tax=Clostridium algidicarnis TaxID=37659 RepID=UPI003FD6FC6B